jgi:hypothetical protein
LLGKKKKVRENKSNNLITIVYRLEKNNIQHNKNKLFEEPFGNRKIVLCEKCYYLFMIEMMNKFRKNWKKIQKH